MEGNDRDVLWSSFQAAVNGNDTAVSDDTASLTADTSDTTAAHTDNQSDSAEVSVASDDQKTTDQDADSSTEEKTGDDDANADGETDSENDTVEASAEDTENASDYDPHDLLDDLPTAEQLLAKHQRIPQATKDELVNLVNRARAERDAIDEIGGKQALEIFKPVSQFLQKPEPTVEEAQDAYVALFGANPRAATEMVAHAAEFFMNDEPKAKAVERVGDVILERAFGEGITAEKVRQYVLLEKAGLINLEEDIQLVRNAEEGSTIYQKQMSEIEELKRQLREQQTLISNPEKLMQKEIDATAEFNADFNARFEEAIVPLAERGRWGKDTPLTEMAKRAILAELKDEPEYKDVQKFINNNGYAKDKVPFAISHAVTQLTNKAKARFDKAIREINGQFKERAVTGQNAQVKAKVEKRVTPQSETVKGQRESIFSNSVTGSGDDTRDKLYREFMQRQSALA